MGFVRYVKNEEIVEDMLSICSLPDYTTGEALFTALDSTFSKYGLAWKNVVGVCTDGAPNMTGSKVGLITRIKRVANEKCVFTHCLIHRESLVAKKLSIEIEKLSMERSEKQSNL